MIALVSEDALVGRYIHKSSAIEKAKSLSNTTMKRFFVVSVLHEQSPDIWKKASEKFFQITGLDPESILDITGNREESVIIRAWYAFLLLKVKGDPQLSISNKLKMHNYTVTNYVRRINKLAKSPVWVNAKWQPLIKFLLKYNPTIFDK